MLTKFKIATTALALTGMVQAQTLSAKACIEPRDLSDAVIFAMPVAYSAFSKKCIEHLSPNGFTANGGEDFLGKYVALQDSTWAGAYGFFSTFSPQEDGSEGLGGLLTGLPPEVVRPLFESIIEMKISDSIKVKDCAKIESIVENLAPLPPENAGALLPAILSLVPDKKEPKLCPVKVEN